MISMTCRTTLTHLSSEYQIMILNSMSKSAIHFYCQGNRCQHVLKPWWDMVNLWKKSRPINIYLGSCYPPTCHGATTFLISAPGPRPTWACSTATFIVMLILRISMLYTTSARPLLEYAVPVQDPHLVKDIEAI